MSSQFPRIADGRISSGDALIRLAFPFARNPPRARAKLQASSWLWRYPEPSEPLSYHFVSMIHTLTVSVSKRYLTLTYFKTQSQIPTLISWTLMYRPQSLFPSAVVSGQGFSTVEVLVPLHSKSPTVSRSILYNSDMHHVTQA